MEVLPQRRDVLVAGMDLILWRHADAADGSPDEARELTKKGRKQAQRMAAWLAPRLPAEVKVIVSPAVRARQTAQAYAKRFRTAEEVGLGARPERVLEAAGWPHGRGSVLVVGHQPTLGSAAALALTGKAQQWELSKGAIWWLRAGDGDGAPVTVAVLSPALLRARAAGIR